MLVGKEAFKDHEVVHLEDEANKALGHSGSGRPQGRMLAHHGALASCLSPHTLGTVAHACYASPWKRK